MMPNENVTLSKEEAHWSSFRSAVAGVQQLLTGLSFSDEAEMERSSGHARKELYGSNVNSSSASSRDAQSTKPQSGLCNERATQPYLPPQDISKNRWDGGNIEISESHRHLELIGLEEVDKSAYGRNNHVGNELFPPALSSAHSSHATTSLSIAVQQLVETKLKLALTESERDELDFQLMQSIAGDKVS
ncbi:hypothetical protein ACHAW5_004149 [Stephanodiscus triporus]|uniref:Uncharacterized protein n=1 Tax=Stephanodiscus triporus TaxID=2934178 RepID=A0ABD3MUB8_9STRA